MKTKILTKLIVVALLLIPIINFGQAINLGTAADFELFTTNGAVTNSGISQITGNVGTNNGSSTGFGNVNGVMHDGDAASAQCSTDLLNAYNQLNATTPTFFPAPLLGNGDTLTAGVYSISAATTLNLNLYLNAQGNPNAVFIFQIQGSFSTSADSKVKLINGAKACNVYWKVEGLVSMAAGTFMKGTIVANNAAINMNTGDTLEGRALSTAGSVTVDGVLAYTPIGCGSPLLTGPAYPNLASTACYALFSGNGSLTNTGVTHVMGDVGTNVGLTTGFTPLFVTGTIHSTPDASTAICATDLGNVYTYLNTLPADIELLYPVQFGRNLVLTPHTYIMNAATTFTDSLYLNAESNANAVFVIKINGALATSTYSKVILINGTQSKNVFWVVNGAVKINNYSDFNGTIVCNNGAVSLDKEATINGRVYTTSGSFTTDSISTTMAPICTATGVPVVDKKELISVFPNPFSNQINIKNNSTQINKCEFIMYNVLGVEVMNTLINNSNTIIGTNSLPSGIYFYKVIQDNTVIQSGKLISLQ
ncbi:MAG: ice-binding family protein [Bacteroidia bacterium]